jgi:predicted metal-dependent phosphoesterase TrpH
MKPLKIQLHVHTHDDPTDKPKHTAYEMLDFAAQKNYDAVSITHHDQWYFNEDIKKYAEDREILLIPGIEKTVERRHVLIINASKEAEDIETFYDLARYKKHHPHSLIVAPHPYYPRGFCLGEKLTENINLFDAIEYSWFHAKKFNMFNAKAENIAKLYRKPLIATSDNHILPWFDQNFSLVPAEKNWASIHDAIMKGQIECKTIPLTAAEFVKLTAKMMLQFDIPYRFRSIKKKLGMVQLTK